jgi:hypothetical protein
MVNNKPVKVFIIFLRRIFMKDVLEERLIITLIALQPKKEKVNVDFFAMPKKPHISCGSLCHTTCKGGCKNTARK